MGWCCRGVLVDCRKAGADYDEVISPGQKTDMAIKTRECPRLSDDWPFGLMFENRKTRQPNFARSQLLWG
jgi:hypothetical protein